MIAFIFVKKCDSFETFFEIGMLGGCIKFLREGREVKNSKASNTERMRLKIIIILESIEMKNLSYFGNRILRLNF